MRLTHSKAMAVVLLFAGSSRAAPPAAANGQRLVRVSTPLGGVISRVATEVAPGEKVPADRLVAVTLVYLLVRLDEKEEVSPDQLIDLGREGRWRHGREFELPEPGRVRVQLLKKEFKLLGPGDAVEAGKIVALVEPAKAVKELRDRAEALGKADSARNAAAKTREEAEHRVAAMEESMRRIPNARGDDYEGAKLTARRYQEEEAAKKVEILKAQAELARAITLVRLYEIRTPVSGVIRSIGKKGGDAVKSLETVLTVEGR